MYGNVFSFQVIFLKVTILNNLFKCNIFRFHYLLNMITHINIYLIIIECIIYENSTHKQGESYNSLFNFVQIKYNINHNILLYIYC